VSERKGQAADPKAKAPKAAAKKSGAEPAKAAQAAAAKASAPKAAAPKKASSSVASGGAASLPAGNVSGRPAVRGEFPAPEASESTTFKRVLIGRVKSDKMNKTVVVEVMRSKLDPVYKKYVRVTKRYQAHDEENACRIGDRVEIIEHRPLSKMKRWKVINLVERAVQE
jgi:small subunit ribosomal protein S17